MGTISNADKLDVQALIELDETQLTEPQMRAIIAEGEMTERSYVVDLELLMCLGCNVRGKVRGHTVPRDLNNPEDPEIDDTPEARANWWMVTCCTECLHVDISPRDLDEFPKDAEGGYQFG